MEDTRHYALIISYQMTWTISSNPYHPLTYSGGITHTWMGESWMVDGGMSVMMVMKISSKSPSRQGARTVFLVPNYGFWWRRRSESLSGKNAISPIFSGKGVYVGERRGRGDGRAALTPGGRGPGGLVPPLRLVFWLRGSSGEIEFLMIFLEFLLKVGFLHKNETPEQFC
jgi:hypothetical protein